MQAEVSCFRKRTFNARRNRQQKRCEEEASSLLPVRTLLYSLFKGELPDVRIQAVMRD